jgi:drug/metabolite transporter (DMT)-like permease
MLIIYLIWGSTYLFIRIVVETMPPLLAAGARFSLAGLILCGLIALRKGPAAVRVTRRQLGAAALVGVALVAAGNGLVSVAEQVVASGLAALIIGSVPLWVAVWRLVARERVSRPTVAGILVGFAGVALLVLPHGLEGGAEATGVLLLVVAAASWATGSFLSRRLPLPRDPLVSTGFQMLCGGLIVGVVGLALGEGTGLDPARFSRESVLSFLYLLVFGSLVAFTAYTWLLQNAPISQVATYAYVNPVVAVALGAIVLGEVVDPLMIGGAVLILASVAFVVREEARSRRRVAATAPAPASVVTRTGAPTTAAATQGEQGP